MVVTQSHNIQDAFFWYNQLILVNFWSNVFVYLKYNCSDVEDLEGIKYNLVFALIRTNQIKFSLKTMTPPSISELVEPNTFFSMESWWLIETCGQQNYTFLFLKCLAYGFLHFPWLLHCLVYEITGVKLSLDMTICKVEYSRCTVCLVFPQRK